MRKIALVARAVLTLLFIATVTGHILFVFFGEKTFIYAIPQNFFAGFVMLSVSAAFTYTSLYPVFFPIALTFVSALYIFQIFLFRRFPRLTLAAAIVTWILLILDMVFLVSMFRNGWGGWQFAADLLCLLLTAFLIAVRPRRKKKTD